MKVSQSAKTCRLKNNYDFNKKNFFFQTCYYIQRTVVLYYIT